MFTGLVQHVGTIERLTSGGVTDVWIRGNAVDLATGESIACDGVCLTVVDWAGTTFHVQAAPETLRRTTLGSWRPGGPVNLERALKVGDRLGGHWVQGHVDAVTTVRELRPEGGSRVVLLAIPAGLAPFFVEKGSVCLDGVSLTITGATADSFSVMLIPETLARTTLGAKAVGSSLNVETDIIGKYVARMMGPRSGLTQAQLAAAGL